MTINDMIWTEINSIFAQKENYDPALLAVKLVTLSALYANLTSHIATLEHEYFKKLEEFAMPEMPAIRASNKAKATDEYLQLRKSQNLEKALIECIRSIKTYIKIRSNEQEVSRNY